MVLKAWNAVNSGEQNVHAVDNALAIMGLEDYATHVGNGFVYAQPAVLAPGEVYFLNLRLTSKYMHFERFQLSADAGPIQANLHVNAVSSGGTQRTMYSRRFDVSSAPATQLFTGVALSNSGTIALSNALVSNAQGQKSTGDRSSLFDTIMLPNSAEFSIGLVNTDASTASVWPLLGFHEHIEEPI